MGKSTKLGTSVCSSKQGLFSSVNGGHKMAGKKQHMAPMWKKLINIVDLDEPTSFLDHVYWGCAQGECKPNESIIEESSKMFESRISAGATEKLLGWARL